MTAGPGEGAGVVSERIIVTPDCVAEGAAHLAAVEPRFARALELTGPLPLRRRKDGFETLFIAIVSQQVSVAAAGAIWNRLKAARLTGPRKVLRASEDELRACGLSRQKIRYVQALARADIDFEALRGLPDAAVMELLLPLPGIGRWTVEMYLIFALGRADVFAVDDLALAEGARLLFGLPERPRGKAFHQMAEAWSPWRAVAARGLWAWYAVNKQREGVAP